MELINNTTKTLKDDLSVEIKQGSKLSIAAACFSIYAFQELKEQLSQIEQLRFIFTSPTFVTEKAKKERREFYIPRLTRERSLYGTEFEIKLRNELTQKAIARECAEWIRQKVTFKSNVSDKSIQGQIVVDSVGYTPINNFTTVELGCEKGNVISTTIVKDESLARTLLADFNEIWNDSKVLQVVTDEVIDSITAAYNENSPDFIYFVTLYNIFNEFLEDVSEDVLPNEATGFKESKIWGMLYNFQKDAALAIINKLEKYNGCILADSVGLGKTFTALAVIKYYENRNKSVLVLCPKKLTNNWNTYKDNYVNNPIAADRLRYDVLYHTDLNRTHGTSNGLDLDRLNWGNYDLVVIDESHNFRNGGKLVENPDEDAKDNRYVTLMKKVIRAGVKTKVLMLSATPVNNRFNDLKNQLALAYEGHMTTGISIMDLGLNEFRLDLLDYIKHHPDIDKTPFGLHSVVPASEDTPAGVIYVLKNRSNSVNIDNQNRLHPFYMVYIGNDGEVICDHLSPKQMLDKMRFLCKGKTEPIPEAYKPFNKETRDGKDMSRFSKLLGDAIASIIEVKDESDIDSFLGGGQVSFLSNEIKGLDDFELICFLVVR